MSFIDTYKSLEKLCNEIYNDNHGVSSYIDEMINTPIGSRYVTGWDKDLKQLKHYRWIRNQIVHEPGCTEHNMCEPEDIDWINHFCSRIMSSSDPLSLYQRARSPKPASIRKQNYTPEPSEPENYTYSQRSGAPKKSAGCLTYILGTFLIVAAIVVISVIFQ